MNSRDLEQRGSDGDIEARLTEVEFALVLSRIITAASTDEEHLRQAIYDLARYKLREQLTATATDTEDRRAEDALEIAIRGVEAFSKNKGQQLAALPRPQPLALASSDALRDQMASRRVDTAMEFDEPVQTRSFAREVRPKRRAIGRTVALLGTIVLVLGVVRYRGVLLHAADRLKASGLMSPPVQVAAAPAQQKTAGPAKPSPLLPTTFGVYALSEGKLFELNLLPSRAQDVRVAISPTVGVTDQPVLADGRVKFIVYRRDAATNIPDHAEVRIIARVAHAISYDASGKQVVTDDGAWYIRNISFTYRIAPVKENVEMFQIQPDGSSAALSPGRYALVLEGRVYDFIVAGAVTDTRHCLERITATNGTFVSECRTTEPTEAQALKRERGNH